jgi:hypothetical protein
MFLKIDLKPSLDFSFTSSFYFVLYYFIPTKKKKSIPSQPCHQFGTTFPHHLAILTQFVTSLPRQLCYQICLAFILYFYLGMTIHLEKKSQMTTIVPSYSLSIHEDVITWETCLILIACLFIYSFHEIYDITLQDPHLVIHKPLAYLSIVIFIKPHLLSHSISYTNRNYRLHYWSWISMLRKKMDRILFFFYHLVLWKWHNSFNKYNTLINITIKRNIIKIWKKNLKQLSSLPNYYIP